jgi:hypothetical protein
MAGEDMMEEYTNVQQIKVISVEEAQKSFLYYEECM